MFRHRYQKVDGIQVDCRLIDQRDREEDHLIMTGCLDATEMNNPSHYRARKELDSR
jgi:hypothetical protein